MNITLEIDDEQKNGLEIPLSSIIFVESRPSGSSVAYQLGNNRSVDQVTNQYGYIKKAMIDSGVLQDGIQMDVACENGKHKIYVSKSRIVAKRGLQKTDNGGRLMVTLDINGEFISIVVKQSFEDIE